ncbi:N-acetylmuramoyl-L-alanine amidase [Allokutzneria sp. A3M-2-11 16]|uniref:peptidoglycan recognition protein family protein n=1 Tax=Allokutzneria sp. A3M-2-11 16 TaxID=2962043 RepID=UPI0020B6F682|nr:N-acetylmuramoyl-L-alanine amidase [Allokutzneria sp. A3M-2-11 16]MCP3804468.1 N-acetylmuramoyl-L-alanine amidase [Allokutzneria sp. A3M-2-11 16]
MEPILARRTLLGSGLTLTALGLIGTSPATASVREAAAPAIHGTAAWRARPARAAISVLARRTSKIIVHHTATPNSTDYSLAHAFALSRSIQNHHMDANGWIDTGQHFTNSRGGHITEGRHRSLEALNSGNKHVLSAHTSGQNEVAFGIENEGLYTSVGPTAAQWNSLVQLCKHMCQKHGIATSQIFGHRDFNNTACPGNTLYARLPELRRAVAGAMGVAPEADPITWQLLQPGDTGERVLVAQHLFRARGETSVPATGIYDQELDAAVRRLEARHGIPSSGLVGAETWPLIVAPLKSGERGEAVRALQLLLTAHGMVNRSDGVLDGRTETAVRNFQSRNGLRATGVATADTWRHLLF